MNKQNSNEHKIYFRKNGELNSMAVGGFSDDPSDDMKQSGLKVLRTLVDSDANSPIMTVVK